MYRFAYDQYGHKGVKYLQTCEQVKQSQRADDHQFGWDLHLYSKLKKILDMEDSSQRISLAIGLLKKAMERWELELATAKQRLRDSLFDFDATIELPCAHYPSGAALAGDTSVVPYLELEKAKMSFSVKASNLVPQKLIQQQQNEAATTGTSSSVPRGQQRHIFTGSFGGTTKWEPNGVAGAEVTLGTEYQESEAASTKWSCEFTAPVTRVNSKAFPVVVELNSSHRFASGTNAVIGLRGSTASEESWQYSFTSTRIFPKKRLRAIFPNIGEGADIRATCGLGVQVLTGDPSTFFIGFMNIPAPHKSPKKEEKEESSSSIFSSPWVLSNPRLFVRGGYNIPIEASINYEEFGKQWTSLDASWSWNFAFSKIKIMLSTDLWGSYEHNDTTTIRTGLRHDLMSGWIWLWEWEELDWTLKVPISLSGTKNYSWLLLAMGSDLPPASGLHNGMGGILASYVALKVAQSMLTDWTSSEKDEKNDKHRDATSTDHQDSFRGMDEKENDQRETIFPSLMRKVAERKRQVEMAKDGLVIRSAVVYKGNKRQSVSSVKDGTDVDSFFPKTKETKHSGMSDVLQFWVRESKLSLPPLSSQKAPHYYSVGGSVEDSTEGDSFWPLSSISKAWQDELQRAMDWIQGSILKSAEKEVPSHDCVEMSIRYQYQGNAYEVALKEDDQILLPDTHALLLGSASSVR